MANVTIPIGPQHPALKEPASFSITLNGEKIVEMDLRLGYNHRGIEKACESRTYLQSMYLIERVCGICSQSHSDTFVRAVESLAGVEIPRRAKYIRVIISELERIHSHLLWLGVAAHEIGFDTLLMYSWRDREAVMDLLALLTGNRVNYDLNTLGGVRRDITPEQGGEILKAMDLLEERTKHYLQIAAEETTIIERLSGVGYLSLQDVNWLGTVGPTARASGWDHDVRRDDPYDAYGELDFKVVTDNHCDVYGRVLVRVGELLQTYSIIRQAVKNMPDGPLAESLPRYFEAGETLARYEAPRGELLHFVQSAEDDDHPARVKVRAPTLANLHSVPRMLCNNRLADVPIGVAAIDPCFSCTDRMVNLNGDTPGGRGMSWQELRRYGIEWYRRRGFDFSKLKVEPKLMERLR